MFQGRWSSAIALGFFVWVGLLVGKIRGVELVRMSEYLPGGLKRLEKFPDLLVHLLKLIEVFCKLLAVVRSCRRVVS